MHVEKVILHPLLTKQVFLFLTFAFCALALVIRSARKLSLKRI
jgi:hypothetical protein